MRLRALCFLMLALCLLSCDQKNGRQLTQSMSHEIEVLLERYVELGRFSGTVLVAENSDVLYEGSFGMADYKNNKPFTPRTVFRIEKEAVKDEVHLMTLMRDKANEHKVKMQSDQYDLFNIAKGYQYHNYRGSGLELQEVPPSDIDRYYVLTVRDVLEVIDEVNADLAVDGYTADDGFSYSFSHSIVDGLSIILWSNRRQPVGHEISQSITAILKNEKYQTPLARFPIDMTPQELEKFEGQYMMGEHVRFAVHRSGDSLFVNMGPNRIHLIPQSADQFYMQDMDASMRFVQDPTGRVHRVVLLDGFVDSDQEAVREGRNH